MIAFLKILLQKIGPTIIDIIKGKVKEKPAPAQPTPVQPTKPAPSPKVEAIPTSAPIAETPKDLVTFDDLVTASGKYLSRRNHVELTDEVKANINAFLPKLNALLRDLGVKSVSVTSGFRPSEVNAATAGAAKKSYHTRGMAIDLFDPGNALNDLVLTKPELLEKHQLWVEDKGSTPNWCHIDCGTRSDRKVRVFKP